MSNSASNQRLVAIAIVVIIALLGINGYLFYNIVNQNKLLKKQNSELIEAEKLRSDLEEEYFQALSDLDELKGNNVELNALIETQKESLKKQKDRISGLLRNQRDLDNARSEISRLHNLANKYIAEIETLKNENVELSQTNLALQEDKRSLTSIVEEKTMENEELVTARAALVSEKESLEKEKRGLVDLVDIASVIKVESIAVDGYVTRKSGKENLKKRAKAIEGLKICFNTTENTITSPGPETFFVRIVTPLGETLAVESLGSGVLELRQSGDVIRYTQTKNIEYENAPASVCMNWQSDLAYDSGEYVAEVYNKGVLSGRTTFMLK